MSGEECDLLLQFVSIEAAEDIELDRLARRFNLELQREGVESDLPPEAPGEGTRGAVGTAIGSLAVKILPSLLSSLLGRIKDFLSRSHDRNVKVKVQLGKNVVEIEYSADKPLSMADVSHLVKSLTKSVGK
jgi:hypothetical protein